MPHHQLLPRRADLAARLRGNSPRERSGARQDLDALDRRLYELRHGARTELGSFAGRLPMRLEERLHDAHRTINARAEAKGWPQTRSPLTRECLARLGTNRLRRVVDAAESLAVREGRDLPEGVFRRMLEAETARLRDLTRGRGDDRLHGPVIEWTR